ncbi:MAG: hypothetical protein K0B08_10020 [Bacteroidales bacterium]|nr:hypothetical protein [Bacteroidales bacterium]
MHKYSELERAIEREKAVEPDPFAGTRILQRLESRLNARRSISQPAWRPVLISVLFLAAMTAGFFVGNQGKIRKAAYTDMATQIEILRTGFYVNDFVDEDINLLSNE